MRFRQFAIPARNFTTTFGIDPDTGAQAIDNRVQSARAEPGMSIQYSMPYLKSSVVDLGLRQFINHLISLVEANLQTLLRTR